MLASLADTTNSSRLFHIFITQLVKLFYANQSHLSLNASVMQRLSVDKLHAFKRSRGALVHECSTLALR